MCPVLVHALAEHVEVEDRLFDRNRERLLGAIPDCVFELAGILRSGDLEDADADAVVRDAEADALPWKLVLAEKQAQRLREQLRLAQLAADDQARFEVLARDLDELGRAVVLDAGRRD